MDSNEKYYDKINIYIPQELKNKLLNDAALFEIFKKDGSTINTNKFLSMLLLGYYDSFQDENREIINSVSDVLNDFEISPKNIPEITDRLLKEAIMPFESGIGKKMAVISFKPTNKTCELIGIISESDPFTEYFRRMFASYLQKPMWERHRIIYYENCVSLTKACDEKCPIRITLITGISNSFDVIPYRLVPGNEGMYNYLVCAKLTKNSKKVICSIRLDHIKSVNRSRSTEKLDPDSEELCRFTVEEAPQYAINKKEEIVVKLSEKGRRSYTRIFFGRPKYTRIEKRDDGYYYYFKCSSMQAYHYFRRYEKSTAEVIAPAHLRKRIANFHRQAYEAYIENK